MTHTSGLKVIAAIKRVDQRSWLTICLTNNIFDTQVCEAHLLIMVGSLLDCLMTARSSEVYLNGSFHDWWRGLLMAVRVMKIRNTKLLQFRFYSHIFSQFLTCIVSSYWRKEDRMAIVHKSLRSPGWRKILWDKSCKTDKWQVSGPPSLFFLPYAPV